MVLSSRRREPAPAPAVDSSQLVSKRGREDFFDAYRLPVRKKRQRIKVLGNMVIGRV